MSKKRKPKKRKPISLPVNIVYSKVEQKERMKYFDEIAAIARKSWELGYAYLIISFPEYCALMRNAKRQ